MPSPRPVVAAAPAPKGASHAVRIIGGQWRRTPLVVAHVPGLRPTPDRVRETVFNWITHLMGADWAALSVLDLFAGTGALGFECASRGATRVLCVENHPKAVAELRAVQARLHATQLEVRNAEAVSTLRLLTRTAARFDLIFLDPPFHEQWLERLLPHMAALLTRDGLVYVESETPLQAAVVSAYGLDVARADKAGQVFYHLLQCKKQDEIEEET